MYRFSFLPLPPCQRPILLLRKREGPVFLFMQKGLHLPVRLVKIKLPPCSPVTLVHLLQGFSFYYFSPRATVFIGSDYPCLRACFLSPVLQVKGFFPRPPWSAPSSTVPTLSSGLCSFSLSTAAAVPPGDVATSSNLSGQAGSIHMLSDRQRLVFPSGTLQRKHQKLLSVWASEGDSAMFSNALGSEREKEGEGRVKQGGVKA